MKCRASLALFNSLATEAQAKVTGDPTRAFRFLPDERETERFFLREFSIHPHRTDPLGEVLTASRAGFKRFDITSNTTLTFEKPDMITFRNLALAQEALNRGGNLPCILNAANEVAVGAFLKSRVGFLEMSKMIEDCMQKISFILNPTLEDYMITDDETRKRATELLAL